MSRSDFKSKGLARMIGPLSAPALFLKSNLNKPNFSGSKRGSGNCPN